MACGRPLFPGSTVEDELHYIFKILGTPNETQFPGLSKNEDYLSYNFPFYKPEPLINVAPRLDGDGLDLLSKHLLYTANRRCSAAEAMKYPFFNSLGPSVHRLPDTVSIFTLPGIILHKDPGMRSSSLSSTESPAILPC
ncbi:cyclin-dependent kinase 17-like isoform X3 [Mytilus trossulus]|uniref:cyclin-dependent kinase 17-like isoform X3 n=1 Tax=Mytilus trossulus TaxID=6551 RepID=UPI00300499A8